MTQFALSEEDWRLIIFDLDGTLIDSKIDIATSVNLTLVDLGLPMRSPEEIYSFVGDGVKRLLRLSVGEDNHAQYEQALHIFRGHYLTHCLDTTRFYEGIPDVLEHFREVPKAVATNKALVYTLRILEGLDARRHFVGIEGGENGYGLKPDAGMVVKLIQQVGVPPERVLMVGDSTNDVKAARAAGIRACAVGYGYGDRGRIAALEPDYFCERPGDLITLTSRGAPQG